MQGQDFWRSHQLFRVRGLIGPWEIVVGVTLVVWIVWTVCYMVRGIIRLGRRIYNAWVCASDRKR